VLRTKFSEIAKIITGVLETHFEQPTLVRHVRNSSNLNVLASLYSTTISSQALDCLSIALAAQDASTWALPITQSILKKVTAVSMDPRPKVRKSAQDAATSLLRNPKCASVAATVVGTFCLHASKQLDLADSQKVVHFVHLLKDYMPFLQSQASTFPALAFSSFFPFLLLLAP